MTGPILASFSMGIFVAVILWAIIEARDTENWRK